MFLGKLSAKGAVGGEDTHLTRKRLMALSFGIALAVDEHLRSRSGQAKQAKREPGVRLGQWLQEDGDFLSKQV